MSVLDRLARAETSSDLRHHPEPCHVDVLKAAGIAAMHAPIHLALFRLKYLNDMAEIAACKAIFTRWAYKAMVNRHIDPQGASRIGSQTLQAWVDDTCPQCHGQKYEVPEGAAALTAKICPKCKGLGKRIIQDGPIGETIKDVMERADDAISSVRGMVEDRLRG